MKRLPALLLLFTSTLGLIGLDAPSTAQTGDTNAEITRNNQCV
jgi:hypothetical protein